MKKVLEVIAVRMTTRSLRLSPPNRKAHNKAISKEKIKGK